MAQTVIKHLVMWLY